MSKVTLLFEVKAGTLDDSRALVEAALGMRLEQHDSSFWGGAYDRGRTGHGDENVRLVKNIIEDDGEHLVSEFPEAALVLYVEGTEREVYFVNAFAAFTRLLSRTPWSERGCV